MATERHTTPEEARTSGVTALDGVRVGLLGLNAWVVVFLVPTLHLEETPLWTWGISLAPLVVLGLGVAWLRGDPLRAKLTLLAAYPPLLGLSVALDAELVEREVYDPITVVLGAASLLAFVAVAARACDAMAAPLPSSAQPTRSREPVVEPGARRWTRRALLALSALGAFAIVGVAPIWTDRVERTEHWGDARNDGAVLTIVVAAVFASVAVGAIIGPGLRADRRSRATPARGRRRLTLALLIATVAGLGWLLLRHLDTPT